MSDNKTIKLYFTIKNYNERIGKVILSNDIIKLEDFKYEDILVETNEYDDIYCNNGKIYLKENVKYYLSFKSDKVIKNEDIFVDMDSVSINNSFSRDKGVIKNISFAYYDYVGRTSTKIKYGNDEYKFDFEIRTSKMDYEKDYQHMINELSKFSNELIYKSKSPVKQNFKIMDNLSESPFEYYLFIENLFNENNLPLNYEYIIHHMYSVLNNNIERVPTAIASNIDLTNLEKYVSNSLIYENKDNKNLPKYIPLEVNEIKQEDEIDNPENQFFKYFLKLIQEQIEELLRIFQTGYPNERLIKHKKTIDNYLSNKKLQEITQIATLPLNSQVLQKKEGYQKILQYYLEFNNIYKLNWKELEELIKADQKKVSALYEKWCYFKLCDILSKITGQELTFEKIFKISKDTQLKDIKTDFHKTILFKDYIAGSGKKIDIELGYNVTFKGKNDKESYSVEFRPDNTIKLIFGDKIGYIHFDSKYKSDKIKLHEEEEEEKEDERSYKPEDIAKMNAYKDAIHNTIGAFILYPGTEEKIFTQPNKSKYVGVGAFPLLPNKKQNDDNIIKAIKCMIKNF